MIKRSTKLLLSAALVNVMVAFPATAQDAAEADDSVVGTDIIVTARRTEERLQDVPISMTVFSNEQLQNRNVATATDLATYTPSLSVNTRYGPEKSSFAIRGFNQDQSTSPTVGVYFADVVGVRAQGGTTAGNTVGAGSFTDLQNVQVLKGPQGTLFGRNTTGGAVLLVPQKPTGNLEGFIEGSIGNYDARRVQAALNVPLADTFKVRLSLDRNKRDGYMKNRSGVGPDDYNDLNYTYARLSIVADLTPDLENYTIAHYSDSDTNGYAMHMSQCDNQPITFPGSPIYQAYKDPTSSAFNFQRVVFAGAACNQIARQAARGDGVYDVEVGLADPYLKLKTWQVINTTTWRVTDNLTLKNIASYGEFEEKTSFSLNSENFFVPALPFPLPPLASQGSPIQYISLDVQPNQSNASQNSFTEELQLQGTSSDGKLNWVVGGYVEQSNPMGYSAGRTAIYQNCSDAENLVCTQPLGFGVISDSRTKIKFRNKGVFAQGTYDFTDQLALTLGGRWTFDKITGYSDGTRLTLIPTGPNSFMRIPACNDPRANGGLPPTVDLDCRVGTGDTFTVGGVTTRIKTPKSNKPTWLVGLDFKPTPDLLVYGKYARGYRQGGINFTNPYIETWEPEKLDSFEVGAKASLRGGSVNGYFNVAGFYNNFSNQQIFASLIAKPNSGISGGAAIINSGKSRLYGIEVDSSLTFFDSLRLDVGYTYLNTKVKQLTTPTLDPNSPFALIIPNANTGDPLAYSPKHKLTVTGTYTLPLDESIGRMSFGATYAYTAKQLYTRSERGLAAQLGLPDPGVLEASNLVNLNFNWDNVAGTPIDFAAFVTNLTKEKYRTAINQGFVSAGFSNDAYGAPRMYGMRLRYRFGQ